MNIPQPPIDIRFEIRLNPEIRQAYDEIYNDEGIRHLDSFYLWLLELLQPMPGRRLLDVACGEGVLPNLGHKLHGLETHGVDLSHAALRIACDEGQGAFFVSSGEYLPFADNSFDYVTCIGSLEHFDDMHMGITEIARLLRPNGLACILLPNTYGLLNNIYKALKTGMSTIDEQPLQRYAARAEWAMQLAAGGLQVIDTIKYEREIPRSLADSWWYVRHPRTLVKLALTPYIPLNLATCFVYLCRPMKKE
ncbi:MAG: class I SAM-dependent methyltransferase [Chloroflexota bacterium]